MELHYCTDLGFYWVDESGRWSQFFAEYWEAMQSRWLDELNWQEPIPMEGV